MSYAWVAEILELPTKKKRVGGGYRDAEYTAEEICHEAAHAVLRLRQELSSLRAAGLPSSEQLATTRSPKPRSTAGRLARLPSRSPAVTVQREVQASIVSCELSTQTEAMPTAAERQLVARLEEMDAERQLLQAGAEASARQLSELREALGIAHGARPSGPALRTLLRSSPTHPHTRAPSRPRLPNNPTVRTRQRARAARRRAARSWYGNGSGWQLRRRRGAWAAR